MKLLEKMIKMLKDVNYYCTNLDLKYLPGFENTSVE